MKDARGAQRGEKGARAQEESTRMVLQVSQFCLMPKTKRTNSM